MVRRQATVSPVRRQLPQARPGRPICVSRGSRVISISGLRLAGSGVGEVQGVAAVLHQTNRSRTEEHPMKLPRPFFKPLAIGAPAPWQELPVRLERMIHFVPPHVEKIRAKVGELIREVDVVLGNLEDAIPADAKEAARAGFIAMAQANDFGATGLWTRINALNSPWALDDITGIVAAAGDKLDVMMLPKVEGPWDIHYLDQLLAQLEARHKVTRPILIHAILETAEGVKNVDSIAAASPRMHGISLGPADLAASRAMKTTRVGGGHPDYVVLADADGDKARTRHQQDLWHYTLAKMVDACASAGIKAFYGPFGDFSDAAACEAQFRNSF